MADRNFDVKIFMTFNVLGVKQQNSNIGKKMKSEKFENKKINREKHLQSFVILKICRFDIFEQEVGWWLSLSKVVLHSDILKMPGGIT